MFFLFSNIVLLLVLLVFFERSLHTHTPNKPPNDSFTANFLSLPDRFFFFFFCINQRKQPKKTWKATNTQHTTHTTHTHNHTRLQMAKGQVGFTRYNIAALFIAHLLPGSLQHTLPVLFCTSLGVATSFHSGLALDGTCWARFSEIEGITLLSLMIGNVFTHLLPLGLCYWLLVGDGTDVLFWHGAVAAAVHLLWGLWVSKGALFCLDHVYVPMKYSHWRIMWCLAVAAELLVGPALL